MSQQDIIRAWRDAEYRNSLSEADQALLPPHPAGIPTTGTSAIQTPNESVPVSPFSIYYSCYWICNLV